MWKMQSEAETGKMSHGIKYPINLNADRWSNTTQPQCFKEDFTDASVLSPSLGLRINLPMRPLTPERLLPMKVGLGHNATAPMTCANIWTATGTKLRRSCFCNVRNWFGPFLVDNSEFKCTISETFGDFFLKNIHWRFKKNVFYQVGC